MVDSRGTTWPVSTPQHLAENIKLRIDSELKAELERLALLGDRNLAQEMRRALRAYVQAQKDGAE
jgi:predicted transcriptional regulator